MKDIEKVIEAHNSAVEKFSRSLSSIEKASLLLISCLKNGNKILLCGNGGSAADCQHFAAELTGRFQKERKGLAAIALTVDTSALTAISNDYTFAEVFARQVEALGKQGDVLVSFSTSGNSENIIRAMAKASSLGMKNLAITGRGGKMASMADICISVDETITARIQEVHSLAVHILCEMIEKEF
ncbi:MAG: D-sedoheptulose 7-phosphate isomerase [Elusimicrobiota bacterium]